jgi:uncharacterized protein (DUF934 family)
MITLKRNGSEVEAVAPWPRLADDETIPEAGGVLVSGRRWLDGAGAAPQAAAGRLGVWLDNDTEAAVWSGLEADLGRLPVVALAFPAFSDGRAYSHARRLRRSGFQGDLVAFGEVLIDQIRFMARVGFTLFEGADDLDPRAVAAALAAFPSVYQRSADGVAPLAWRREGGPAAQNGSLTE